MTYFFLISYQNPTVQPRPNLETQPFWFKRVQLLPNGHNKAGFAFVSLRLATMATLHFRALHKTNSVSQIVIQKNI